MYTCSSDGGGAGITPFGKSTYERLPEEKQQLSHSSMHSHLRQVVFYSFTKAKQYRARIFHARCGTNLCLLQQGTATPRPREWPLARICHSRSCRSRSIAPPSPVPASLSAWKHLPLHILTPMQQHRRQYGRSFFRKRRPDEARLLGTRRSTRPSTVSACATGSPPRRAPARRRNLYQ